MFSTRNILCVLLTFVGSYFTTSAQVGIAYHQSYGFVWAHTKGLDPLAHARPVGFHLSVDQLVTDSQIVQYTGYAFQRGVQLSYVNFQSQLVGEFVGAAYYLQPNLYATNRLRLGLRLAAGFMYATKPYHADKNPLNLAYSIHVNPYLALQFHTIFVLGKQTELSVSAHYDHVSNGGMYKPNRGLNYPNIACGVTYRLNQPFYIKPLSTSLAQRKGVQATVFYSNPVFEPNKQRYNVQGINAQIFTRNNMHGWLAGFELAQDYLHEIRGGAATLLSTNVGHEFLLGKFIFSQELGIYLRSADLYQSVYHRWGLIFFPKQKTGVGVSLKVHGESANFIDLRLVTHLYAKRKLQM